MSYPAGEGEGAEKAEQESKYGQAVRDADDLMTDEVVRAIVTRVGDAQSRWRAIKVAGSSSKKMKTTKDGRPDGRGRWLN